MTVTDPSASSAESSAVATANCTEPLVGTATVREPVATPKSPVWATVNDTLNGADGAGLAVTVKEASAPSVTPEAAVTLISGSVLAGGRPATVKLNEPTRSLL